MSVTTARPLSDILEERGITRRKLGEITELSHSTIDNASTYNGRRTRWETALIIATALGLEPEDIEWPDGLTAEGAMPRVKQEHHDSEPATGPLCLGCFQLKSCSGLCDCNS